MHSSEAVRTAASPGYGASSPPSMSNLANTSRSWGSSQGMAATSVMSPLGGWSKQSPTSSANTPTSPPSVMSPLSSRVELSWVDSSEQALARVMTRKATPSAVNHLRM